MNMNIKKTIALVLVVCLCCSGCSLKPQETQPIETIQPIETTVSTETTMPTEHQQDDGLIKNNTNITNRKLFMAITNIVEKLLTNDTNYATYLYIPKNAYMSETDLKYILSHMGLDILNTYTIDELAVNKVSIEEENKLYTVILIGADNSTYILKICIDEDGQYKLDLSPYFARNVSLRVPTTAEIKIDNQTISKSYLITQNDQVSIYTFDGIVMKNHEITCQNGIMESILYDLEISESNQEIDLKYDLTSVEAQSYLEQAQKLYQNTVKSIVEFGTIEGIQNYFVDYYSNELLNKYLTEPAKTWNIWQGYPIMTKISHRNDVSCTIIGNNMIELQFKYELVFDGYDADGNAVEGLNMSDTASMTIMSNDNLNWKIVDIDSKLLLSKCNSKIINWNSY